METQFGLQIVTMRFGMLSRLATGLVFVVLTLNGQQPPVPEFVPVPAGEFSMGSAEGAAWERPAHPVETPDFAISARPVSNREFQAFRPEHRSPGDESPDAPVTGVTWDDAEEYALWLQGQLGTIIVLPSEARWERAVRGGLDQQTYPWGDEFMPASLSSSPTVQPNGFGVYAVGYNLWEWTADWYASDYYSKSPREDPTGPTLGDFRVLRGGGFRSDPASATCYSRGSARPLTSSPYITFRVMKLSADPVQRLTGTPAAPPPQAASPAPVAPPPAVASVPAAPPPRARPTDVAAVAPPTPPAASLSVTTISFEQVGAELQIHLAMTGRPAYRAFAMTSPDRVVVDLEGVMQRVSNGSGSVPVNQSGVKQVRYSQFQPDPPVTRVVVDLDHALKHQVEASDDHLLIRLSPAN